MGKFTKVKVGDSYFHFVVIGIYPHVPNIKRKVRVICDCGNELDVNLRSLTLNWKKSCGCKRDENKKRINANDLIGEKFNKLTVIKEVLPRSKDRYFLCQCDCGNLTEVAMRHLKNSAMKGCGCQRGISNFKHGYGGNRIYGIWKKMRERCYSPTNHAYLYYGGRGIKVCEEWNNPINFVNWALLNGYNKNLTIDRINNNGNYEPSNCRWVTMVVQSNNRRDNVYYYYKGIPMTIPDICRDEGIWEERHNLYYQVGKMGRDLDFVLRQILHKQ
jgi:hypothetical protein